MTDLTFDPRDLEEPGRPERRHLGRRTGDLLVEIAKVNVPAELLEATRAALSRPDDDYRRGVVDGIARALEGFTGEAADEIRARARALVLEELAAGRAAAETCRLMLERSQLR